ncbi:arginine kinase 1 isoform X1 [Episyrphus balteatus]|uniref:arginine kinase 1 isoform X1 n=1 Tax=Episyrphus balteatus TaxID=286459 RepID=UPI00248520B5|nr:arginine kinase 1 isoform X1 [Episyrphus balteatus]
MFALWYLSLALDEIRKRLGWTSIFDIFKSNKIATDRAIEQKPEPIKVPTPKTPEPAKPAPVVQPEAKPTPPPKPAPKPDPPKPKAESPSAPPTAEPIKNVTPKISSAESMDRKIFGASKNLENGESKPKANIKEATSSFLEGEGQAPPTFTQTKTMTLRNKSDTMVDAAVLQKLEDGFAKLAASDSKSLLKKYLTKEVFDNLKNKKTPSFGSTLLDVIQSGLENHDSGVGIYAPDAEAYSVFSELFDPIIEDYHGGFKKTDKHPARDFGDVSTFTNVDPNNEFVVSTRVRCGRSLQGYPFNPCLSEAQYKEMEEKVSSTLSGLEGELKGKFYPLTGMEKAVQQQLIDDHFLFKEGDRFLQAANACRYWPSGRGIYHNDNKTFLVWCNEEDHLRIISMQMGGDLGEVYRRLVSAVNEIEKRIPFSHDDRLGFLTFCPTNLGTTIRASVHIKVPKLAANKAKLEEVASKYNLQVRGTRGEHTEAEGGIYDISNKRRMGLTEYQAVKEMYDGITELIKLEKSL